MNIPLRPILSTLLRNWAGPVLVASQIAIALAVLVNSVYIVKQRVDKIGRPTGMDVENIFVVRSLGITGAYAHEATIRQDLDWLRAQSGVIAATPIDYPPLNGRGSRIGVMLQQNDQAHAVGSSYYEVDEHGLDALGLRLAQGRNFTQNEVLGARSNDAPWSPVPQVIISRALAKDLFPDGQVLGKTLHDSFGLFASPATVIGVLDHMHGGRVSWDRVDRVVLAPRLPFPDEPAAHYAVRVQPGKLDSVARLAEQHLMISDANRMIEWVRPLEFFRHRSYVTDRNMGVFLVAVTILLLAVISLGMFGLTTFNVNTRIKQIGTRRALGAQKADVVAYFLVENVLVTSVGILLGCVLALLAGYQLSVKYQLPRLDLYYLVGGIPVLWVLGLLAAGQPAWRAAKVSPAVATRTV